MTGRHHAGPPAPKLADRILAGLLVAAFGVAVVVSQQTTPSPQAAQDAAEHARDSTPVVEPFVDVCTPEGTG